MYRRLVPLVGANRTGPPPPNAGAVGWPPGSTQRSAVASGWPARRSPSGRTSTSSTAGSAASARRGSTATWPCRPSIRRRSTTPSWPATSTSSTTTSCTGWQRHHELHGSDLGPIGDLLAHGDAVGSRPRRRDGAAAAAPRRPPSRASTHGRRMADALRRGRHRSGDGHVAGRGPGRAGGGRGARRLPRAVRLAGRHELRPRGADDRRAAERDLRARSGVRHRASSSGHPRDPAALRALVPEADRTGFDELLADARRAYGMRDDNGPLTAEWPMGLLRRAFLEAGQAARRARAAARRRPRLRARQRPRSPARSRGAAAPEADETPAGRSRRGPARPPPTPPPRARPAAAAARHLGVPTGHPAGDEHHHRRRVQPRGRPGRRIAGPARPRHRRGRPPRRRPGRHRSRSGARRDGARRRPRRAVDGADLQRGAGDRRRRRRAGGRAALPRRRDGPRAGHPGRDRLPRCDGADRRRRPRSTSMPPPARCGSSTVPCRNRHGTTWISVRRRADLLGTPELRQRWGDLEGGRSPSPLD